MNSKLVLNINIGEQISPKIIDKILELVKILNIEFQNF